MRRRTLLSTGAAAIVVAGGGWAMTRAPRKARAPWREAEDGFGDIRLDALAYAILAPNPHNMQPWMARLDDDNGVTIFCNTDRLLPHTDPPSRQITIGFGCFLELLRQAAAENGWRTDVTPFPEGEPIPRLDERPVAHIAFVEDGAVRPDPLFSEALARRTNRTPFDTEKQIATADLAKIALAADNRVIAQTIADDDRITRLRKLTADAWRTEWSTLGPRRESIAVTRVGKKQINEAPWGLALSGAAIEAVAAAGMLTPEKLDDATSTAYAQSIEGYVGACETAMAYAVIKTRTNTRRDQLAAGAAWIRMQLAAKARGVAFHPLSQALQEFPEMAEHYRRAHEILGADNGETVQMLSRLGFAPAPSPAPRETLASKLINAAG
ncbi:MAG: twin-arginine translocation pathway signal protein [Pseudomonadota bacterium]